MYVATSMAVGGLFLEHISIKSCIKWLVFCFVGKVYFECVEMSPQIWGIANPRCGPPHCYPWGLGSFRVPNFSHRMLFH